MTSLASTNWCLLLMVVAGTATAAEPVAQRDPAALLVALLEADPQGRPAVYDKLVRLPSAALVPVLKAWESGLLRLDEGRPAIYQSRGEGRTPRFALVDPLTLAPLSDAQGAPRLADLPAGGTRLSSAERKTVQSLIARLRLYDADAARHRQAIREAGQRGDSAVLDILRQQLSETSDKERAIDLRVAIANIDLARGDRSTKLAAAQVLEELAPLGSADALQRAHEEANSDAELVAAIQRAQHAVERHQQRVNLVQHTFAGLSLGSILVLMALGLSIIFGLMGVINMAHGEFMMVGAFTALLVSNAFRRYLPPAAYDYYWPAAVPLAFAAAAGIGWLCEVAIIRRLYGRPFDSLLATWGISLILIQGARVAFGDTVSIAPPRWFEGGWEAAHGLVLPWNRLFIIGYCGLCVLLTYLVVYRTRFGLLLRAATQNRDMAAALGVNVRRIDALTFALGTGLAGAAGLAVILFDSLSPQMGQSYIVDSFLVVVTGGVGKLEGVIASGCALGFLAKYLEPWLQAVYGKVALLLLVVALLQWRPSGLFADKGRLADE